MWIDVRVLLGGGLMAMSLSAFAGDSPLINPAPSSRSWEVTFESAQLFGLNNRRDYYLAPQILSLAFQFDPHWRVAGLGITPQLLVSGIATPVLHGPETHYFGGALRTRFIGRFRETPWSLYSDLGGGAGGIDSTGDVLGQGQDFTFNILAGFGVRYALCEHGSIGVGALYQHFSNAKLSEPEHRNTGLDAIGPNVSFSLQF